MRARAALALAVVVALSAATAAAQTEEPPPEYFSPSGPWLQRFGITPYGDLRLRYDRVVDRPGTSEDIERGRGFARAGLFWAPHARAALQVGFYSGLWQAADDAQAVTFDNEHGDSLAVDRLAAVITPVPAVTLALGKLTYPLDLSEMTWDADLRPVGATAVLRRAVGTYDQARLAAAAVRRARPGDDDLLLALQLGYALSPGAARSAEITFSFNDFDGLDHLAREGLGRQNRLVPASGGLAYANDFRTLEAQLVARTRVGALPVVASVHGVTNSEVDHDGQGIRARATLGDLDAWPRVELAYVYQRIEREALPGAFNSDDWWFHTRARGHRAWLAARFAPWIEARVSGNLERRDDVSKATRRALVELKLRLPGE